MQTSVCSFLQRPSSYPATLPGCCKRTRYWCVTGYYVTSVEQEPPSLHTCDRIQTVTEPYIAVERIWREGRQQGKGWSRAKRVQAVHQGTSVLTVYVLCDWASVTWTAELQTCKCISDHVILRVNPRFEFTCVAWILMMPIMCTVFIGKHGHLQMHMQLGPTPSFVFSHSASLCPS